MSRRPSTGERAYGRAGHEPTVGAAMTLGEACERYWHEAAETLVSSSDIRYRMGKFAVCFGSETLLGDVSASAIAKYAASRKAQKSRKGGSLKPGTVNYEIQLLRRILRRAEKVWGVTVEPIDWRLLRLREPPPRQRILTFEEEERLIAAAAEHLKVPIRFALLTGLRVGEIRSLDWCQIDLDAGVMHFVLKGGRSHVLPITPAIRDLLVGLEPRSQGPVFTYTPRGANARPRAMKTWNSAWRTALRRAGIENLRFHDLRHTVGTRLVQSGTDLSLVQDVLGHEHISTTRRYIHHDVARKAAALRLLEREDAPTGGILTDQGQTRPGSE